METIAREVKRINQVLMDRYPFWAIHAARVELRVGDKYLGKAVKTAAIDGEILTVNPEYWESLIGETRYSLYSHEIGHVGLGHHLRRDGRDFGLWNKACDYELNLVLLSQGYKIPSNWLLNDKYKGWSAERIYADLNVGGKGPVGPKGPVGDEPVEDGEPCEDGDPSDENEEGEETGEKEEEEGAGGGESGEDKSDEEGEEEPNPSGEVWDPTHPDGSPLNEGEKEDKRDKLSEDIQMAEAGIKGCGKETTAETRRSLDRVVKPKKNWKNILDRWINERGAPCGRSWSRLDRRAMVNRIYQPGEIKDGIDWLLFAVDVSGSVGRNEYDAFASHMDRIRENVKINRITLMPFNETIQSREIVELKPEDKTPTDIWTGGGTAFSPIFNWVRRQPSEPDGVIVFTDLCCDDYGTPCRAPILWASTDELYSEYDGWGYGNIPPFGDVVQIDISQE